MTDAPPPPGNHPAEDFTGASTKPTLALEVTAAIRLEGMHSDPIHPAETCAECPDPVEEHQYLVRIAGRWLHVDCGQEWVNAASQRELLLTLASHMSYNPSKYPAGGTRWVLRQLLRLIATQDATIRNGAAA